VIETIIAAICELTLTKRSSEMPTEVINVKGMSCMGCVNKVKAGLENTAGVKSAEVSLEQKQVTVQYDDTTTQPEKLKDAIKKAGYEVVG
jgi:copper chaperone